LNVVQVTLQPFQLRRRQQLIEMTHKAASRFISRPRGWAVMPG
jgi:hypothetical protein